MALSLFRGVWHDWESHGSCRDGRAHINTKICKVGSNPDIQYTPYKRSPFKGRILLSDILGRRRPVGFVRETYLIRGVIL
jgi:hypothetical protein